MHTSVHRLAHWWRPYNSLQTFSNYTKALLCHQSPTMWSNKLKELQRYILFILNKLLSDIYLLAVCCLPRTHNISAKVWLFDPWSIWFISLDWIEQCFTSPPTQYRLHGRRFLQVKRPNQQYQKYWRKKLRRKTQKNQKTKCTHKYEIVHSKKM